MHKTTKIFITLFFIFILNLFYQTTFAKYVLDDTHVIANVNVDRNKPIIELVDVTSTSKYYPTYANHTHLITGHIKIIESNIIRNELSADTLQIAVGNQYIISEKDYIDVDFKSFFLLSETPTEKVYEFSFTNTIGNGALVFIIPEGIVEDRNRSYK